MARIGLQDRRILVTGASSGIGKQLATQLFHAKARILITSRRDERLQELKSTLVGNSSMADEARIQCFPGDITDASHREQLIETARQRFGGLDMLVNNAGIGAVGPFEQSDPNRLKLIMDVNFISPAELIRTAIPELQKSNAATIVNIGSVLAFFAPPKKSEYAASKFALRAFSDAIRIELATSGIHVLCVHPNTTKSEFFEHLVEKQGDVAENPFAMTPDRVASKIVRAIERRKKEVIITSSGRLMAIANALTPSIMRFLFARMG